MSVGSTPLPRIPPAAPWRPRRKTESPAGWRGPAEELPRPDERGDARRGRRVTILLGVDRKSTRLNSSHGYISYAVFCLKKKKTRTLSDLPCTKRQSCQTQNA